MLDKTYNERRLEECADRLMGAAREVIREAGVLDGDKRFDYVSRKYIVRLEIRVEDLEEFQNELS